MPSATVTVTVTLADAARAAVAITRTDCPPPSSDTSVTAAGSLSPSSKLKVTSSSSSTIGKLADLTSQDASEGVPENRMVSSPSTSVSDTGVTVSAAERPTVSPLLMVTVAEVAEIP